MIRFLISAGEASGDIYGAQLMEALRRREPSCEFLGVGGQRMRAAGCDIVVDASELAVVGLVEILERVPRVYLEFRKLLRAADQRRPNAAIVIDSPAFNFRVARQMHRRSVPTIYYVSPQLWAWRQGRVRLMRSYIRKALVIFPFEEAFFRRHGVDAEFVGHPLAEPAFPQITREEFASQNGLDAERRWIALLPGSRQREVVLNLPTMLEAVNQLGPEYEFLLPVASTLEREWIQERVRAGGVPVHLTADSLETLAHARAAIVASGTATVEAAVMNTPFVMVYRVTPLTHLMGRWMVKVPHFAMVNLIAGREVVPELVQDKFTAENVVARVGEIIAEGTKRQAMLAGLAEVRQKLHGGKQGASAAERAADAVLRAIARGGG